MASFRAHPVFAAAAIAAGAYFLQCGGDPAVELPNVVYGGNASDEALERVWPKIATAQVSDMFAARITSPMNGATISSAAAPQLTWALPGAQRETTGGGKQLPREKGILYFGSAVAEAHLPPVTGDVFLIEFTIPGDDQQPLRLFTTETFWTPDPDSWARIKAATGAITVKIYNSYVNQNVLEEGPYTRQDTVAFTIGAM